MVRIAEFGGKGISEQRELGGDFVTKRDASNYNINL